MIPNKKSNTNGCNPLSSNCVVWQGPDLECIDLCAGDTISDVVAKIAHALCECCDPVLRSGQSRSASTSDISTIIQGCITINKGRDAQNLDELLQFIIDKICETDQTLSRSAAADPTAFATAYLMPLPQAAQFDQGSTRITEQVLYDKTTDSGWIITIGNYIGGLQDSVTSIQRTLENHEERIANIERSAGGTTIGGARAAASGSNTVRPTTVDANGNPITPSSASTGTTRGRGVVAGAAEQVVSKYLLSGSVTAGRLVLAVEKQLFELRRATGLPGELLKAIGYQQQGLAAENRLNGNGTMGLIGGFNGAPRTVADAIKNLWITTNDMRAAVADIKASTTPSGCKDIVFSCNPTIKRTSAGVWSNLSLDFRASSIPTGYSDSGTGRLTKVTITDASLNVFTTSIDVSGRYQRNTPLQLTDLGTVDKTSNLVVKVEFAVTNGTNDCGETVSINVTNASPCPTLTSSSSTEKSISYTYSNVGLVAGGSASVAVNLLNSLGSVIQTRTYSTWGTGVTGSFNGLIAGTTYQLQFQMTTSAGIPTTCPSDTLVTSAPSCTSKRTTSAAYSSAKTDQVSGSNSIELAVYNDTLNIYQWLATFDNTNTPIVIYSTITTTPAVAWTHAGSFVSDNPVDSISCGGATYTATGMTTAMADSGWKYAGALTSPTGTIFYAYALINSVTKTITEVVFCCDCKQITLLPNPEYGVFYCTTGGTTQCKINVIGDVTSNTVTPLWTIVSQPGSGTVVYDAASSSTSQGVFNYTNNGNVWTSDSFTIKFKNSCNTTAVLNVPIIKSQTLSNIDEDIIVFLDTTTFSYADAVKIKATFNAIKTALVNTFSYTGNINYVPLGSGGTGSLEPGDYIKHVRSIIDSANGVTSTSISIATGGGTWDTWKSLPSYWTASSGAVNRDSWPASVTVFSFVNQTNTNGLYGSALLANGFTTPTQPTTGGTSATSKYMQDFDSVLNVNDTTSARSAWTIATQAKYPATGDWKNGSIPFVYNHFVINMITGSINESAAAALQILAAATGAKMPARNFFGSKIGGAQFPVDLQAYLLDGVAAGTNPYTGSTGTAPNTVVGLENHHVVPHMYFENGIDWSTTNTSIKEALLGMMGITENSLVNVPSTSMSPRMLSSSSEFAFDASAAATACGRIGNAAHEYKVWNSTGTLFDPTVKAYSSQSAATNAQSAYELAAGWYAVNDSGTNKRALYVPAGPNYWTSASTC